MRQTPSATLLVFTLGASADSTRRPLLPGRWSREEVGFRRVCLNAALAAGREAGCRLEVSSPRPLDLPDDVVHAPQAGPHFGARLDGAMRAALGRRPGPVVVVGSDVPGLTGEHVRQALEALADDPHRVVLGPSPDGGFYLLAAHRPVDGLTADVRWCCGATLATLRQALEAAGRPVTLLAPVADLDRPQDLGRFLAAARRAAAAVPACLAGCVAAMARLLADLCVPALRPSPVRVRSVRQSPRPPRGPPRFPLD